MNDGMAIRGCPDCPDLFYVIDYPPESAWIPGQDGITFVVSRTAWETEMAQHWRDRHPGRLEALGMTVEGVAAEAQASMDRMIERFTSQLG
jgi:hypothetical protein